MVLERGRESSDAVDGFLHTLYIYLYALPTSKSKMSQAACYASRLSLTPCCPFLPLSPKRKIRGRPYLVRSLVLAVRVDDYLHRPTLPIIYRILFFFSFLVFFSRVA